MSVSSDPASLPQRPEDDKPNVRPAGPWAQAKLGTHEDYLRGFAIASKRSPHRIYLDLFCGPGKNQVQGGTVVDGSPLISLTIDPPFTHCVFVDRDPRNIATLRKHVKTEFPNHPAQIITAAGDCNQVLPGLLKQLPRDGATFAFHDPEGVDLYWQTVVGLARHKGDRHPYKVEQFILFPYNFGIARMLNPDNPSFFARMTPTLNAVFGNEDWKADILQNGRRLRGDALRERITSRYMDQLRGLGYAYVQERLIATPNGHPLYYLIFASDHNVGDKIMRSAFGQDHGSQLPLLRAPYRSMRQPRYRRVAELDRFEAGLQLREDGAPD
jgi:three-Cys-motif partner protein